MSRRDQGFTLVELMVTITVIGILGALSISKYQDVVRRNKVLEPVQILHSLYVALSAYYYENGVVYMPPGSAVWLSENTALPGLSGWKLPRGKKRFQYIIFGSGSGTFSGNAYAVANWSPPDIDFSLVSTTSSGGYTNGWSGGGYMLTYMALDRNGDIYGWAPDGQPLAIASGRH